jgi:hypothetical protein
MHWFKKRKHAGMPVIAELVLDLVSNRDPMTIMDLVHNAVTEGFASHSTIHNSLAWLKTNGYIKTTIDLDDERLRVCMPTDKARRYFEVKHAT